MISPRIIKLLTDSVWRLFSWLSFFILSPSGSSLGWSELGCSFSVQKNKWSSQFSLRDGLKAARGPESERVSAPTFPGSVFTLLQQVEYRLWVNSVWNYAFISHKYGNKSVALCCSAPRGLKFQFISFTNQVSARLRLEWKLANQNTAGSAPWASVSIKGTSSTAEFPFWFKYNSQLCTDRTPPVGRHLTLILSAAPGPWKRLLNSISSFALLLSVFT